jgi:hypothetical protein
MFPLLIGQGPIDGREIERIDWHVNEICGNLPAKPIKQIEGAEAKCLRHYDRCEETFFPDETKNIIGLGGENIEFLCFFYHKYARKLGFDWSAGQGAEWRTAQIDAVPFWAQDDLVITKNSIQSEFFNQRCFPSSIWGKKQSGATWGLRAGAMDHEAGTIHE